MVKLKKKWSFLANNPKKISNVPISQYFNHRIAIRYISLKISKLRTNLTYNRPSILKRYQTVFV